MENQRDLREHRDCASTFTNGKTDALNGEGTYTVY